MKTKYLLFCIVLAWLPVLLSGQGMTICSGTEVTVTNGASIRITNGELWIKANGSTTAGSLVLDDNVSTAVTLVGLPGKTIVEQYLPYDEYHYVSTPISNQTIVLYTGIYLLDFVETNANNGDSTNFSNNWVYLVQTNTAMNAMHGYAAWNPTGSGTNTFGFRGTMYNGPSGSTVTMNPAPTNSGNNYGQGWNIAGNPYPCAIDWGTDNSPVNGWTKTNLDKSIYFWDGANAQYAVFNSSGNGVGTNSATSIIPSTQGFFIHVKSGYASGTLKADNRVRLHSSQAFWKQAETVTDELRIRATGNNHYDEMIVRFIPEATAGFDPDYDSYKLFGGKNVPQVYSVTENNIKLSINSLPDITQNLVVPVGYFKGVNGTDTLTASQVSSFAPQVTIFLEDKKLNVFQDLRVNPVYIFIYDTLDDHARFALHFSDPYSGTPDIQAESQLRIYSAENTVYIRKSGPVYGSGWMFIYDPLGREVFRTLLADQPLESFPLNLNTGYYMVKVVTGNNVSTRKVFLYRR